MSNNRNLTKKMILIASAGIVLGALGIAPSSAKPRTCELIIHISCEEKLYPSNPRPASLPIVLEATGTGGGDNPLVIDDENPALKLAGGWRGFQGRIKGR